MIEIAMPELSSSVEQATILSWLKADGEQVNAGEDLVEIEADKATTTYAAENSGILQIVAAEGATLPVGATIARLADQAEAAIGGDARKRMPGAPETGAAESGLQPVSASAHPQPVVATLHVEPVIAASGARNGDGGQAVVKATPLARRVARAYGVSLEEVAGSGLLGRVTRSDVLAKAGVTPASSPPSGAVSALAVAGVAGGSSPGGRGEVKALQPNRLQALVARRMSEANAAVPHFQVQAEVAMDDAIGFRVKIKRVSLEDEEVPSFNDLIVKAVALALSRHPLANSAYRDGRFELYSRINVGIAVAAERALVVPTIFDADRKSLREIAVESRRLAAGVREGTVTPSELADATFTVSNLGMYGMSAITPVVNLSQAAILGVGALREVLSRVDGEMVDRHLITLTLSCDHRILYGAEAAEFLSTVRGLLEEPVRLVL